MQQNSISFVLSLLLSFVFAIPAPHQNATSYDASAQTDECNLENLMDIIFNRSLTSFFELFKSPDRPSCYHWCSNACSWSPDSFPYDTHGDKISWKPACARHDFSWHNLKKYGAFDEENKLHADNQLRDGMVELCGEHKVCVEVSEKVYYTAVRHSEEPAMEHAKWEPGKKTDCTIFPGCCANHSDTAKCGPEPLPGQFRGDLSCVAR
jgi:hypothetical protein